MDLSQVYSLQLELTSYCNARCPHCPRYDGYGNLNPQLQLDKWDWLAVKPNFQIPHLYNLKEILLQGDKGDPVMHPNITEVLEDFSSTNVIVELNTNGGIRSKDWWSNIAKLPNFRVAFSIDGLEDTSPIYRQKVNYQTVIENAKSFIKNDGYAIWQCLIFKHNEHQMRQIRNYAIELGFKEVRFASCDVHRFHGQSFWNIIEDGKIIGKIEPPTTSELEIKSNDYIADARVKFHRFQNQSHFCPNLKNGHLYINCHGDVVPCCMMHFEYEFRNHPYVNSDTIKLVDDFIGDRRLNNLHYSKLSDILNNQFFTKNLTESFKHNKFLSVCESSCGTEIRKNLVKLQFDT